MSHFIECTQLAKIHSKILVTENVHSFLCISKCELNHYDGLFAFTFDCFSKHRMVCVSVCLCVNTFVGMCVRISVIKNEREWILMHLSFPPSPIFALNTIIQYFATQFR